MLLAEADGASLLWELFKKVRRPALLRMRSARLRLSGCVSLWPSCRCWLRAAAFHVDGDEEAIRALAEWLPWLLAA
jgi:hypothetical protein